MVPDYIIFGGARSKKGTCLQIIEEHFITKSEKDNSADLRKIVHVACLLVSKLIGSNNFCTQ